MPQHFLKHFINTLCELIVVNNCMSSSARSKVSVETTLWIIGGVDILLKNIYPIENLVQQIK
jgi:hypothetical protein